MAKYYGVERSDTYLAHYGIRGMRWGVRNRKLKKWAKGFKEDLKYGAKTAGLSLLMGPYANMYMGSRRAAKDPTYAPDRQKKRKPIAVVNLSGKPLNQQQIRDLKKLQQSKKRIARV